MSCRACKPVWAGQAERKPTRCGVTRKVIFKSEAAALYRGSQILAQGARGARKFRAYHCPYCGFYHITSK